MSPPTLKIDSIGQIAVPVKDIDRATEFYRDVLQMPFFFGAPDMAFFNCGDVRVMLAVPEKPELDHPSSIIYYRVDDVPAAQAALAKRGVHFEEPPRIVHRTDEYDLWMAFFRDSEDNILALMCEAKPDPIAT